LTDPAAKTPIESLPRRTADDRRWCSDRRVADRRRVEKPVEVERRVGDDRRAMKRRSGFDRRGDRRCRAYLLDATRCNRNALLRDSTGDWWCLEHAAFSSTAGD
jgi:hypothetical protein